MNLPEIIAWLKEERERLDDAIRTLGLLHKTRLKQDAGRQAPKCKKPKQEKKTGVDASYGDGVVFGGGKQYSLK